ncbi:DNA polymerase III subunit chi [Zhongshania aliphaticivorans]|uniref:DNA polymerase III subunit chi n=1 Tax=Zhongshania aliphaticivorans TaxID=1470434 RepID=A0A5S9QA43_9GAMM|nr:DNA polymerase III subunit chi [Zhongshania aliphaticivorans]CAA0087462.1 DNA polymerase III subunit chi [Zhongshania aliphaticivorans]CAA0114917.1 DNA polymerase III subunit chi [Zhongshania aliphaticivorans]CAA0119720.1 DNA polymerase III subunit chi [Zhongshania aliphaticivorans]
MTRIDFHILQQNSSEAAMHYACRLTEKAWRAGHKVYVHCDDVTAAEAIDTMLWQYRAESFVPHSCHPADQNPVLVGCGEHAGEHCDVFINLAKQVPMFFSRFKRLAEIVSQEDGCLSASRERYSFYKTRGYPLNTHNISG